MTKENGFLSNLYTYENGNLLLEEGSLKSRYNNPPPVFSAGGGWSDSYCGIVSSADDYFKLLEVMLNKGSYKGKKILTKSSVENMIRNHVGGLAYDDLGEGVGYGLGVGVIPGRNDN
nr:hypothetical protein [Marinomonas atlantica]